MTTQMLYLPSHPLYLTLHPLYQCNQTQCINYNTPNLCKTTQAFYLGQHIQYAWHHMKFLRHHTPICMISHPVYLWHPIQNIWYHIYCFHENTATIPDISLTLFDITATASVLSHPLYWCHHNNYGSHHTWHTYDIMNTLHHIPFKLWDINLHHLWHHNHCIHDIRSIYDITSTVYDISSPGPVISQPLYL